MDAPHLAPFGDTWRAWRWAVLRGAGFPARRVLDLAHAELAAGADLVLAREADLEAARSALVEACDRALASEPTASELRRTRKQLRAQRIPSAPIDEPIAEAARQQLVAARAAADVAVTELGEHYRAANLASATVFHELARDDRFRQAVLLQNRPAVHNALDWLLRQPAGTRNKYVRQSEQLIASYLQRYSVKNDTISFFGPVGWARLVDDVGHATQVPGGSLLAKRTVYYERWGIEAIAQKLAQDPALRPDLRPFRLPQFRLEDDVLCYPIERTSTLSPELAAVAARCDGERTARELARSLAEDASLAEPLDEEGVFAVIDELVEAGVVVWTLDVPTVGWHPERALRAQLERITDSELRARNLAALDELDELRVAVERASDTADLDRALGAFDDAFVKLTGGEATRAPGRMYAARTPLFEDCRRDLALDLGTDFQTRVSRALEPVLDSARWYTHEIAAGYREQLRAAYERIVRDNESFVDYQRFSREISALFGNAKTEGIVVSARDELRRRWTQLLAFDPAERVVRRDASAIAAAARTVFAAPGPGWTGARYHSPDLMIAARGPDAFAKGDYRIVLGELHASINTVVNPGFVKEHPNPPELVAMRTADSDRVSIGPVLSKDATLADVYSLVARDVDYETGDARSARPRAQVVTTGELVVENAGDDLFVRTRDHRWRFDIITFLESYLSEESFAGFSLLAPTPHTPRIELDDLVIARETWRLAPLDFAWAAAADPEQRFLGARRWARALGMPRWMFVKTPEEVKPIYIDLDSVVFVEILAKQLRAASSATFSEMLPGIEDTWLLDADGALYTAELRIAALDLRPC